METCVSGSASWLAKAFGNVRRVMPGLIAHEIVSVQSMAMPAASILHLDYIYDEKEFIIHQLELPFG